MTGDGNTDLRKFSTWGQTRSSRNLYVEPGSTDELLHCINEDPRETLLAFGCGRSYGDVAVHSDGTVVLTTRLNKIHSFDQETGELVCDAGATIDQIVSLGLQHGYVPTVSPGTAFVTVGGAIANDVHGKNHDMSGSFCDHVNWIELVTAQGELVRASDTENPELFQATIGGIGLTGIIARVSLTLLATPAGSVRLREMRCANLDEFIDQLEAHRATAKYSVGWIDAISTGASMGRGILEIGEFAELPVPARRGRKLAIPFRFPGGTLNRTTVRLFNEMYYRRIPRAGRQRTVSYRRFTYPLDSLNKWYRIYGRNGFFQFQCVLPDTQAREGLHEILKTVSQAGCSSFLAVLKTLGSAGKGMLSFPVRGFTLAMDIPNKPGVLEVLDKLEELVCAFGGRMYLAKDTSLSPAGFRQMYPRVAEFEAVLENIDPHRRFRSDMSNRLRIRGL